MIPGFLLNSVYTRGSLRNVSGGFRFELVNRLADIDGIALRRLAIDREPIPLESVQIEAVDIGNPAARQLDTAQPFPLPMNTMLAVVALGRELAKGKHEIEIAFETGSFGCLQFAVEDDISEDAQAGDGEMPATPVAEKPQPRTEAGLADLVASSIGGYLEWQKKLLDLAIQPLDPETLAGERAAEAVGKIIAEVTPPLIDAAQRSALNLVAAGKLFLDLATRPAEAPDEPPTPKSTALSSTRRKSS
jgi:hypothetical protein